MAGESSSSTSKSTSSEVDNKNLLKFYQKKFEEYQRKDDKYKEKVDKHLKNLISDRVYHLLFNQHNIIYIESST